MSRLLDLITLRGMGARDRRAVLLGGAVLLPALLWIAAVRPYRAALADVQARVEQERALLEREEALLADAAALPATLDQRRARADRATQRLVTGLNSSLAEAELTGYLEDLATLSRVLLQDIRTVAPRRGVTLVNGSLRTLRLSIRGESDLEGVLTFLQRVESHPLLMRVSEFSSDPVWEGSDRSGGRAPTGVVQFTMILEAFAPAGIEPADTVEVR